MTKMDKLLEAVRRWTRPWPTGTEPMEIRRAVLDEVESRIVSAGGGKRVFPFNRLRVRLLAPGPREKVELEALVGDAWDLPAEIRERIAERGCPVPPDLDIDVEVTDLADPAFGDRRYRVDYERAERAPKTAPPPATSSAATVAMPVPSLAGDRPTLELTVLKGSATQRVYSFPASRVYVGRMEEIVDEEGRVRRRNDVAFQEAGDVNQTVSREHARILFDEASGELRLRAEPGASSTRIFRDGRSIDVSGRDPRGVRIQSGDEIYFGRACVKVAIRPAD
ncbi:MAG TPA: FHA domain-containing protein [Thermoanaerobaculia bacterium]|nr:FHA domain-containing protein [Thermoanaerobaculia bacterium]